MTDLQKAESFVVAWMKLDHEGRIMTIIEDRSTLHRIDAVLRRGLDRSADSAELLSVAAWLDAHPLNEEQDRDDCFPFDAMKEAQDAIRTLLGILKPERLHGTGGE